MYKFLNNVCNCVLVKRTAVTRMTGVPRYLYANGLLDLLLYLDRIEILLCL